MRNFRTRLMDNIVDKYGDRPEDERLPGHVLALWCVLVPSTLWEVLSDSEFWRQVWVALRREGWPWR